jgi:hypothetical protein
MRRTGLLSAASIGLWCALLPPAASEDAITIRPEGATKTLYRWSTDRCEDAFIPDAPARAFRRADGQVTLIATHKENWSLRGKDFASLKPFCRTLLSSEAQADKDLGELWIEATHTKDGKTIVALVSEDLTTRMKGKGCAPQGKPGRCWLNNVLIARSSDMGESFELLPRAERSLATISETYPAFANGRFGVFTTSNIVEQGAYLYMMAFAEGDDVQRRGNCLFRTSISTPEKGWRAWNGTAFAIDMSRTDAPRPCPPLAELTHEVRSLSFIAKKGKWVAVYANRLKLAGDRVAVPGFYFSHSSDLLHWSKPVRIMPAPTKPREQQRTHVLSYPSLIDPESRSRNFDTVEGDRPLLFFTWRHLADGHGALSRDLAYVPLSIE